MYQASSSPDELVIKQRGRRHSLQPLCLNFTDHSDADDGDDCEPVLRHTSSERYISRHRKRRISSLNTAKGRTKCKRLRLDSVSVSSQTDVHTCTSKQSVEVFSRVICSHPKLVPGVVSSSRVPDLQPLEDKLAYLKKAVYRAFPSFRWKPVTMQSHIDECASN